jgi:hypothetical protein
MFLKLNSYILLNKQQRTGIEILQTEFQQQINHKGYLFEGDETLNMFMHCANIHPCNDSSK